MISALSSALAGLQAAGARVDRAAETIVRAAQPVQEARPALAGRPLDRAAPADRGADLPGAMVELRLAANSYKASIAAARVADRMQDALLDITS